MDSHVVKSKIKDKALFPAAREWAPTVRKPPKIEWTAPELPDLRAFNIKSAAVDVETCDPELDKRGPGVRRGAYIAGLAVGLDVDGPRWYFPIRHEGGGNMDPDKVMAWARSELNALRCPIVGTNLGYDLDFLEEEGVDFRSATEFHDVQVAEPLLDEWRMEYNLDALARDYIGEGKDERFLRQFGLAYGFKTNKALKQNLWRLPGGAVGPYGEGDVDRPLKILPKQLKRLEEEGLSEIYTIERKLIKILVATRRRGVRIDVSMAEKARDEFVRRRDEILKELERISGIKGIQLMVPDSFVKALQDRGIVVPLTDKTEKWSVTKPFLEKHQKDPFVKLLMEGRRLNTAVNTFMEGQILRYADTGRIHPTFRQSKSEDGGTIARLAGDNPNMQFIPKRDQDIAPLIRGVFLPDEGDVWQRDDYEQIEYRLLAHFAVGPGSQELRDRYAVTPDINYHKIVAGFMGVDPSDKVVYQRIKITNFSKVYGGGPDVLSEQAGCTLQEAKDFIQRYDRELPFVKSTYDRAAMWGSRRGFVVTIMNRKQRFPFWEPFRNYGKDKKPALPLEEAKEAYGDRLTRADTYKALNRKMQGSNADIIKKAMVDAQEAGLLEQDALGPILLTVHDELDTSVKPTAKSREAGEELKRVMERVVKLKVPVLVDSMRGANWGVCG